jgi:hypothetical protein
MALRSLLGFFGKKNKSGASHQTHPKTLDYSYITDGIYIGTNQCCMMGISDMLKKEGITSDISLEETKLDQPFGVESYVWIPVRDGMPPTPSQLSFGVNTIEELVKENKKVYVHCKNGHGRAPTLVAAYLVKKGSTAEEAINFIKSKRPVVHLEPGQIKALMDFEKSVRI